jgi:CheY-like chemotaxis protein
MNSERINILLVHRSGVSRPTDGNVIALTAKAMKGDREECIEAGATDYITKPVKKDQLIAGITNWLRQQS